MNSIPVVLVIEDDPHIARLVGILVEEAGYQPIVARTAAEALAVLDQQSADLVILDWMLPDMPGDQICRVIKQSSDEVFLPVLMLTARSDLADRVAGLDAGADDYVTKPFHGDELMARARALLRIRTAERARADAVAELARQHQELKLAYERLSSAQTELVQASKLAALGELVAGVAHELNNPLAIILGNAELLPPMADEDDRRAVRQIIDAAQRSRRVLQSLVTFARRGHVDAEWHDPRDLVQRVLDLKQVAFQVGEIALEVTFADNLPMLWGDGPQLQQVLLGLLNNAEQALLGRPQPRIVIRVTSCLEPVEPPAPLPDLVPAHGAAAGSRVVVFDLADNGPGLAPQVRERLFEPYVTTRPFGQGSGMSLALAYGVVQQHGGTMQVASEPERGVTFRIALPAERKPQPPEAPRPAERTLSAGSVLVIDDEPAIVTLMQRLLARAGYRVIGLAHPRDALDELARQRYDTVFCDVRLPEIDGLTLYDLLSAMQLDPAPRLVIMTGDANSPRIEAFLKHHDLPVLRKPFTYQELIGVLERRT